MAKKKAVQAQIPASTPTTSTLTSKSKVESRRPQHSNASLSEEDKAKLAAELAAKSEEDLLDWSDVDELANSKFDVDLSSDPENPSTKSCTFDDMIWMYAQMKTQIDDLTEHMKPVKLAIQAALAISGLKKVRCNGWIPQLIEKAGSRKLEPGKLVKLGVDPELIVQAYTIGKPSSFLEIRKDKHAEDTYTFTE